MIAAVIFWIGIWWMIALAVGSSLLLPTPWEVIKTLAGLCVTVDFWLSVALSLLRVVAGICASVIIGMVLAVLTEGIPFFRVLISPLMTVVKSTPIASFIILLLIWIGRNTLPAFISALIVIPIIWENTSQGIRSTDKELLEMGKIFGFSRKYSLRYVYMPSMKPYILSGLRAGIGIGWKAGIAAEVLVVPAKSIGRMIFESKTYMLTPELFAWTLATVILSIAVERLILLMTHLFDEKTKAGDGNA